MKIKIVALILILLFASVLFSYNLQQWPAIWYDEGVSLQVSKNLAQAGRYGIQSSEGFREFDSLITIGPTVTLPIALVFKTAGVSVDVARMVIVLYALLTVGVYFFLVEKLFNLNVAIVASLLLIALSASFGDITGSFLALSRMVMGEVPALFWLLLGYLLWFRQLEKGGSGALVAAGLCIGLAVITKPQYLLAIAAWVIIYLIDRFWYRQLRIYQVVIPVCVSLGISILWQIYPSLRPAVEATGQSLILDRLGAQISIFSLSFIVRSIRTLLASGILIWGIPGLVYGMFKSRQRDIGGIQMGFLLTFCFLWLCWYIFGSISWIRYAFPIIAIMTIFIAALLVDLTDNFVFTRWQSHSVEGNQVGQTQMVKSLTVTVAIAMMVIVPLQMRMKDILNDPGKSPLDFASYLQKNVPTDAVIESFEPEIVFLTNHNFHQPNLAILQAAVRFDQMDQPYPSNFYPMASVNPDYLVLGPLGRQTKLYKHWLEGSQYTHDVSIGEYDLLKIVK